MKGSSPKFQDMVNRAHSLKAKDVPDFKSENFQKAAAESRLKLLKRIKIVYDTISLYNKVVTGVHYIGIFGAEDAGKSTFIKVNLIRSHKLPCCHLNFILAGVELKLSKLSWARLCI